MKRLSIILAAIVAAVSCSKDAELCSVVFDCTITTDALPKDDRANSKVMKPSNEIAPHIKVEDGKITLKIKK